MSGKFSLFKKKRVSADTEVVDELLSGVHEHIASFPGHSQYGIEGGGTSACGLAAMNCARIVLGREKYGVRGKTLLRNMMERQTLEDILQICHRWASPAHLDVDEIHRAPIFDKTLQLVHSEYSIPGPQRFQDLLRRLQEFKVSAALVITRPPEIISVMKIITDTADVFVIFDSHPRTIHPEGAALIFRTSLRDTANYLYELLKVDQSLIDNHGNQWQAQMLANFSGHIFVAKDISTDPGALVDTVLEASLEVLQLKAQISELREQNDSIKVESDRLRAESIALKGSVADLSAKLRTHSKDISIPVSLFSPGTLASKPLSKPKDLPPEPGPSNFNRKKNPFLKLDLSSSEGSSTESSVSRESSNDNDNAASVVHDHSAPSPTQPLPPSSPSSSPSWTIPSPIPSASSSKAKPTNHSPKVEDINDDDIVLVTRARPPKRSPSGSSTLRDVPIYIPDDIDLDIPGGWSEVSNLSSQASSSKEKYKSSSLNDDDLSLAVRLQMEIWKDAAAEQDTAFLSPDWEKEIEADTDWLQEDSILEQQEEYLRLQAESQRKREKQKVVVPATFNCGICLEEESEFDVAHVDGCDHMFCRDCLRDYIKSRLAEHRFPILCPVCAVAKSPNAGTVSSNLIQLLGISEKEYAIFTELELAPFSIPLHCRMCTQEFFVDKAEYEEETVITCPLPGCLHAWCKHCSQTIDSGGPQHSCDGTNEFAELVTKEGWQYCPGCKSATEKISGCNHMTCTTAGCNTHFCYRCGGTLDSSGSRGTGRNSQYTCRC